MNVNLKFAAVLIAVFALMQACKKEETSNNSTFEKSKLTDKNWYNADSSRYYNFAANGTLASTSGTWHWKGTSDTLLVDLPDPLLDEELIFNYITDTEMRCRYSFDGSRFETFKSVKWK